MRAPGAAVQARSVCHNQADLLPRFPSGRLISSKEGTWFFFHTTQCAVRRAGDIPELIYDRHATDFCDLQKTPRNEAVDFALMGLSVRCSIHQQHTKKKDQIEHRKHEQATSGPPFLVIAPTNL